MAAVRRASDPGAIAEAAEILRRGGLVAFPTETVYGLGADATDDRAVARVFEAKNRPEFNPLIVHVPDLAAARPLVEWTDAAQALAARFWPGPLSLVLPRLRDCPVSKLAAAGLSTLAVRAPGGAAARALLEEAGRPVAAPSANPAGAVSPTRAEHVVETLGDAIDLVIDDGPCTVGIESTVVDLGGETPALLRPGGLPAEEIEALTGPLARPGDPDTPRSPGQLASHYAPALPLRIGGGDPEHGEALLSFGPDTPSGAAVERNLSPSGNPVEAAANLFAALHALDRSGCTGIVAMPVPETGLGRAIMDRLRRAAAPRALVDPTDRN
ncbi:MAG: L-threonylcarbamoyladenylate synthase [Defluviicoccus sp.]|nr:L-threonylcarbamoyladenylate synthase [Defluviicoccus sp.]MDE0278323.1 L-threonylcarbamoyladenylate synthase [Defluviicoccus sp.]